MTNKRKLSTLNDPPRLLDGPKLLHGLIKWTEHENACAVDFTGQGRRYRYSYREVKSCIEILVSRLQDALASFNEVNQQSGQHVVPLFLPQSPGLYVSQMAVLESGGAFCPINLDAPQERIKFVVGDVSAKVILTTADLKEMVTWDNGPHVIVVDEFPTVHEGIPNVGAMFDVQPSDLAYVMYTSGSSGTPKGVAVSHLAASQSLLAHERHIPGFGRFLQFAAPSFDVSVFEIFFPLVRGSTLVGCTREQLLNNLPGTITALNIDAAELTPTVAGSLLQTRANAPCLKILLTIGEMLTSPIIKEFGGSKRKESMLYGMYGPTEAAIHCNINPRMLANARPGNIGLPLDTVSNFIAAAANGPDDAQMLDFLPAGEVGELVLGGPQLAKGYLNRDEQNKAAFVSFENNFYYRTGDKARILEDGTVEIYGRISAGQVKLRGQRVELGEIEEAVYKHAGVRTVVAAVLGSVLVVFALVGDEEIESQGILETCSKWLPKFMMPSEIVLLQQFPYLPSGKVDKRKLESDYQQRRENYENSDFNHMSETEIALRNVLQQTLGRSHSYSRLGAAGLDSLSSIRVSSKLRSVGFSVSTLAVLGCDTFSSLVRLCEESKLNFEDTHMQTSKISPKQNGKAEVPEDVESILPCTPLQSSMLAETSINAKAYWNWIELEFCGIPNAETIQASFVSLAQHNPILRTEFFESEDASGYIQLIRKRLPQYLMEVVGHFDYSLNEAQRDLQHPIRVQIRMQGLQPRLLLHIHHALYDAWSLELLLDDFDNILMSNPIQSRPPFTKLVMAYSEGVLLESISSTREYWKDHLVDLDIRTMPSFHTGKPSPSQLRVARLETSLATSLVDERAKRMQCSPQSIFQGAYSLILASYFGTSDVCFGTVFSGRTLPLPGIENIAGPCLATLPVRADISLSSTLQGLVHELNTTNRKHMAHSALPLHDIKLAAGVQPRQPLFDTLLIWQQTLHDYDHKWKTIRLKDSVDNLEFNLALEIIPGVGNIELKANYQQSLLPETQIHILLKQIERIVLNLVKDEYTSINNIFNQLPEDLLSIENPKPQTELRPQTLSSPVEKIAAEDPNRLAIAFAESITSESLDPQEVSYRDLNIQANQIGHYLIEKGVLPDEILCICLEKSVNLYASILAVTKVGAGYLPVTPDIPFERLQHVLREARVRTVIINSSSRHLLECLQTFTVIDLDYADFTSFSIYDISPRSESKDISYCVFTSGSTGAPKGVLVTQGNLLSNLDVLENIYPASKDTRLLQSCSQAFDVSVFEIFFTWRVGGCLCSATKEVLFRDIELAIRALDVTHLSLTPTVAALIDPKNVPKVKFLVTAGEAVTQKVFNAWANKGLYQGYGPSETTNICTANPRVSHYDSINNIGRPFFNTSAFVLQPGPEFALVPRGGEGEFCFGGSQVFRGYLDKEQEVGKIIDHPTHGKLYRSGDFGRLMPDGTLVFTGRKDEQVKIRGQRVELGEINNVMLKSSEVKDCVTIIIKTENEQQVLVCFWSSTTNHRDLFQILNPAHDAILRLFNRLQSTLPAYMIPSVLIPVSSLPSTAQGKIDKRLLANKYNALNLGYLASVSPSSETSVDHKWTGLEISIAQTVSHTTNVPQAQITPDVSFFAIGIDSISAITLARRLTKTTHRQVKISDILKCPSVRRLAENISSISPEDSDQASINDDFNFGLENNFLQPLTERLERAGEKVSKVYPCTPLQVAMLSAADSSTNRLYYNEVKFQVNGDSKKLEGCWIEMSKRHEILRTCFVVTDLPQFPYVQVVLEDFKQNSDRDSSQSGGLHVPYTFRFDHTNERTELIVSMHHALYDGVALEILYDEVEQLYHQKLLLPVVSFAPFLQQALPANLEDADRFWSSVLRNVAPCKLLNPVAPTVATESQPQSHLQRKHISIPLSKILNGIKKHSTSLLAACHTVWAALLSGYLHETDICFGNVVSGRTISIEGIERLVAPCFNTIPVRLSNIHKATYLEALRSLQNLNADSLPFQFTPLRRIQSKFSPDGSRLFDTLFILQQPAKDLDTSIWKIKEDNGIMDFPLIVEIVPRKTEDALEVILHSSTSVVSKRDATELLDSFEKILTTCLEKPRQQILSSDVKEKIAAKKELSKSVLPIPIDSNPAPVKEMSCQEEILREIIADFTEIPAKKIGKDVSIFRLGLDSISAVQVAGRLQKQGHNVLGSDILEHPTIRQLASHLQSQESNNKKPTGYDFESFDKKHRSSILAMHGLQDDEIEDIRPCTAVQSGILAQTLHSGGEDYFNSIYLELHPFLAPEVFKASWNAICSKYEILRTGFVQIDDHRHSFAMIILKNEVFKLPWMEAQEKFDFKRRQVLDILRRPWALELIEEGEKQLICFQAHHALYDAQSLQLIFSDVAKTCFGIGIKPQKSISTLLGAILQRNEADEQSGQDFWQRKENKVIVNRFPDLTPLRIFESKTRVQQIFSRSSTVVLEQKCREHGVTMQAACQAAWARVLAAYTGETSTTFGVTLSGRSVHEEAGKIAFPAIVTLPVRCDVSGTNSQLLHRTVRSNAVLQKYQFTPLTSIQKWSEHPEGGMFDTLFAYQKFEDGDETIDLPWSNVREEAFVDYAISLEVLPESSGELVLRLTFRTTQIPEEHAEMLLRQYDALLHDTLEYPEAICDLALDFGDGLLSVTPAHYDSLPGPVTLLHDFVSRGAQLWPDKFALEFASNLEPGNFRSKTWTYQQLEQESNRVANLLLDYRVTPGQLVGICFDKCAEASFAIIGIMKAGCAYVALDPTAPIERLKYISEDSQAKVILTVGILGEKIKGAINAEIISLDDSEILSKCSAVPPTLIRQVIPQDVSYCLYTSGTTGTPKGCLITHENAVQAMYAFQILFANHWTPESKWLQFASFHFDVSVLEQFWSWSVGICIASAPRDLVFEDIPGAIQQLGITHIDLTPSLARLVHPDEVPSLTKGVFITGGEPLKQEILDVWGEHACVYNGYGPTEATIGVTMYPRVPKNGSPSNIGPAFENVGSFVLKPGTDLPVLRGGVGELCVSGKLVGKGYLNRPELTEERFPTLKSYNERVYRTGDLVRILHDGSFIFIGRADDQVKLRGQRLELSEINEVIKKSTAGLNEVVTLVLKHTTQQKEQLVAFFVITPSTSEGSNNLRISSMRGACKSRLPGYMVPTHFIPIKKLPLNANNKADSKQIAAMYNDMSLDDLQSLSDSHHQGREWTENEASVVATIANIIDVEISSITRVSNIFELGIDSISIIGFARKLQVAGLKNAKLSLVKTNPSINELVTAMLQGSVVNQSRENSYMAAKQRIAAFSQRHLVAVCKELNLQSSEVESIAPCTPVQEGLIYKFLESDSSLYFNEFEFLLEENIDQLWSAWYSVIDGLQILRTKFVETDDGYAQVVLRPQGLLEKKERLDFDMSDKSAALKHPLQLALRARLVGGIMRLRIFHGLYDGNSLAMLLRKVIDEFRKVQNIDYGPLFHDALPYGPLAEVSGAQEFWTQHLASWSPLPLLISSDATGNIITTNDFSMLEGFEYLRKQLGVSHQAIVQAAWISVLQNIASPEVTLGVVTSGRALDFEGAENIIGPLFNTIPFHVVLTQGMTTKELIRRCHCFNMKMTEFQHTPLKHIQKWSPARPGESLFDTLFVFQRPDEKDQGFADGVWMVLEDDQAADYPLALEASLSPDSRTLTLMIVAQGAYISEGEAEELLVEVVNAIELILKSGGQNMLSIDNKRLRKHVQESIISQGSFTDTTNVSFAWNQEAQTIRTEISGLAKVAEESVDGNSSIFELGLDSIDVIKLSSRLKKKGIILPVSGIIKAQTIPRMMSKISAPASQRPLHTQGNLMEKLSRDLATYFGARQDLIDVEEIIPATPLQQTMVNEMLRSNYTRYFNLEAFKLDSHVDLFKFTEAIERVIDSSPILRTTFMNVEDPKLPVSYAQAIHKRGSEYALSIVAEGGLLFDETFDEYLARFSKRAAELAREDLAFFQIRLVKDVDKNYMIIAISHALYDGTSIRAMHKDFSRAYAGLFTARPDFKPFLEQVFHSTTDQAKTFWKTTLSSLPVTKFPTRKVNGPDRIHRLEQQSRIPLEHIEATCKASKITMQTLGQTCWALVLAHLIGHLDVIFGSVLSCRDSEEASEVMFPLMNTVAVRSVIHGTVEELLKHMQNISDRTREYQHFPLGTAQAYALASRSESGETGDTTLFDTLFIYQGRRSAITDRPLYESVFGASDVEFPVCVEMEVVDDEYITWTTASSAIAAVDSSQIIELLEFTLHRLVSEPQSQTIDSTSEGISVCGLPRFMNVDGHSKTLRPVEIRTQDNEEEWSTIEFNIRKALHELSQVSKDAIKKETTIFHLGLDSILVLKLPALLKSYGIQLRTSDILKAQNVAAMAKIAANTVSEPAETIDVDATLRQAISEVNIEPYRHDLEREAGPIQEILPVTSGQLFMIRNWQSSRGVLFYPTFAFSIPNRINKARLDRAWRILISRHEILRTGFLEVGAHIFQIVYGAPHNDVIYQKKGSAPIRRHDLTYPPVNLILEEGEGDAELKLVIHHALYDGVSLPVILLELELLYKDSPLQPATLKFRDFVAYSHAAAFSEDSKQKWVHYLQADREQGAEGRSRVQHDGNRTEVFQPSIRTSDLRQKAQSLGISTDALLLATISQIRARQVLPESRHDSIPHLLIGIYHSNRAPFSTDLSTLCAPTLNLLPLIIHDPLSPKVEEVARNIQADLQKISEGAMASVNLEDVYGWTGKKVDFWVNILKDSGDEAITGDEERIFVHSREATRKRACVVEEVLHSKVVMSEKVGREDYSLSIDAEIRYRSTEDGGEIDMGIFAPTMMLDVEQAAEMVEEFVRMLR